MALGEARVEIKPDLSAFDAQLRKGVTDALNKVQTEADKTGEQIEDSFREAARSVSESIGDISQGDPFAGIERDAERAGESIEGSFREAARQSESAIDGIGGRFGGMAASIGGLLAGAGITAGLGQAIEQASDLGEAINVSNLVFGEAAASLEDFYTNSASAIGLTEAAARQSSAQIGGLYSSLGYSADEAAAATEALMIRAADLGSAFNAEPQEVVEALGAALRGEAEPARRFNVILDEAALKAKAMELGLYEGEGALTNFAKAQASTALIMEQSSAVAGDFANTNTGLANSMRTLKADIGNAAAELGQGLLPAIETVALSLRDITTSLGPSLAELGTALGSALTPLMEAIGPAVEIVIRQLSVVLTDIGGIFSTLAPLIEPIVQVVGVLATALSGSLLVVFQALAPVIVQIGEFLGIMADILGEALFGAIDALAPILMEVGMIFADTLGEILPVILDVFRELAPVVGELAGMIGNLLAGQVRIILPVLAKLITSLVESLAPILPVIIDAFMQVYEVIGGALLRVLMAILPPIGELIAELVAGLAPILPVIIDAFLRIVLALEPLIPALLQIVTTLLPPLSELLLALVPIITEVVGWLAEGLAVAIENLAPLLETVIGWIVLLAEQYAVLVSWLADHLQPAFDAIVAYILDKVVPAFMAMWAFIRDKVIPIYVAIYTTIYEVAKGVGEQIIAIVGFIVGIPGRISATVSTLWNGLRDGITAAKDWIGEKINEVVGFVTGLPDRLRQGLANIASAGLAIGAAFINALKSGITGVAGFATDVATAIVNAFKSAWNTVAREINNFLPNNIGVGPFAINLPDNPIPTFADGTIAYGPTMGIFGEAGAEAVIPITRPRRALELMEQSGLADLARSTTGGGALVNIQSAVFATPSDADLVAQRVLAAQRSRSFAA